MQTVDELCGHSYNAWLCGVVGWCDVCGRRRLMGRRVGREVEVMVEVFFCMGDLWMV